MKDTIRIGTRDSQLATYQAELVKNEFLLLGLHAELIFIRSKGDLQQDKPVQQLGEFGVFTKALDEALLKGEIDIAVHSYKDIPTSIHPDLEICSVLKRGDVWDVVVYKEDQKFLEMEAYKATIATGSPRRKAIWLNRFPSHEIVGIRGNVDTRLKKLDENNWDGTILALAGLTRLGINHVKYVILDWMLPAPAQGAIAVMKRRGDNKFRYQCNKINDFEALLTTRIERDFLKEIEGGCVSPIAAMAHIVDQKVVLNAVVLSPDGKKQVSVEVEAQLEFLGDLGLRAAEIARSKGVEELIQKEK